jgi:dephospho-CoA kinase
LEIPLLLETGGERRVDVVVVCTAPDEQQRERVMRRPNMTLDKLQQVLARQMPDAEKRARADFIVDTGGTLDETAAQVDNIVESLRGRAGTAFAVAWA